MTKLSLCLGLPAIDRADGSVIGYVKNVYFDKIGKIFAYFCLLSDDGARRLLPIGAAICAQDALLTDGKTAIKENDLGDAFFTSVLGVNVYSHAGALKGALSDAQFSPLGKPQKFFVNGGEILPSQIAVFGDVIFLKSAPRKAPRTSIPRPKSDAPVYILSPDGMADPDALGKKAPDKAPSLGKNISKEESAENDFSQSSPIENGWDETSFDGAKAAPYPLKGEGFAVVEQPAPLPISLGAGEPLFSQGAFDRVLDGAPLVVDEDAHTPTRVICDYGFLLGRTLGADLLTYTGELIAPRGAEVTPQIVERARSHGKLVELTLNSVKP